MFREFTFNSRIHLQFIFFAYSQSPLRIHFEFTIFFANSLWIHFFRELTFNSLSIPRIHWKFSLNSIRYEFTICFANSLLIHFLFRELTFNSLSIYHDSWYFLIKLLIHFEFTSNLLSSSRIHYQFTIFLADSLWIHYLFR